MRFYIQHNIGKVRFVVNYHDGQKTHQDGSDFFDVALFNNERKFEAFVRGLRNKGYVEGR